MVSGAENTKYYCSQHNVAHWTLLQINRVEYHETNNSKKYKLKDTTMCKWFADSFVLKLGALTV